MKLIASLLIAVSLALGAIAATTAYSPRLGAIDPEAGLTLNAPAGAMHAPLEEPFVQPKPIATRGAVLTEEVIAELRKAGVERVTVKEFDFARWDYWWLLAISVVGLIVGAVMIRVARRRALAVAMAPRDDVTVESPEALLRGAADDLASLRTDLREMKSVNERLDAILERITRMQQQRVEPFINARPLLVAKLGMGGYAQLMDAFAVFERQINRAWSAAADEVLEEAHICLENAAPLLDEAIRRV